MPCRRARLVLALAALFALAACKPSAKQASGKAAESVARPGAPSESEPPNDETGWELTPGWVRIVRASWYNVPKDSLARRRAGGEEWTAAHNRLPLGTLLRVTHLGNGKSVIVRITDRGIPRGKPKLDLCKEAAEQLGMVAEGIAKVRIEMIQPAAGNSR